MANMLLCHKNYATRAGALTQAAGAPASQLLDEDMDRVWQGTATTDYVEFMTGGAVLALLAGSTAISANLRSVHVHPTGAWVLLAVSTQLEIRSFNEATGAVGSVTVATLAQPSGQAWLAARFSPDGKFLAATCESNASGATLRLHHFNPASAGIGGSITLPSCPSTVPPVGLRGLAWASNTRALAYSRGTTGSGGATLWRFDPATAIATHVGAINIGASNAFHCLDFHPSMPASGTGYIVLGAEVSPWVVVRPLTLNSSGGPTAIGSVINPGTNPGAAVVAIAFSPTGDRIACSVITPKTFMYPWSGGAFGTPWSAPATDLGAQRNALAWSPGGTYVVYGGGGVNAPDVYQAGASAWTAKVTAFWHTPSAWQNAIALAPSGKWFLCITSTGGLEVTAFDQAPAAARPLNVIALIRLNCTRGLTVRVRGNSLRDMFAGGGYDSAAGLDAFDQGAIGEEIFEQVADEYGVNFVFVLPSTETHLFWRVDLVDPDLPEQGFCAAFLVAGPKMDQSRNFARGASPAVDDEATDITRTAGNTDVVVAREGRRRIDLSIRYLAKSVVQQDWVPLALKGRKSRVLFLPNPADAFDTFTLGFFGRPVGDPPPLPITAAGRHDVGLRLEEIRG